MTKGLGHIICGALLVGMSPVQAYEGPQLPPPATGLRQSLQRLQKQGRILSLEFEQGQYRIKLLSSQGYLLRFRLDPHSGELKAVPGKPASKPVPAAGVMPLESLLQKHFGQAPLQLLEAELDVEAGMPVYELEWVQNGQVIKARFDARSGRMLSRRAD